MEQQDRIREAGRATHTVVLCLFQGSVENPGINQRALKHLFGVIEERKDMWSYTVTVCSVEIYNEVLRYSGSCVFLLRSDGQFLMYNMGPDHLSFFQMIKLHTLPINTLIKVYNQKNYMDVWDYTNIDQRIGCLKNWTGRLHV